MRDLELRIKFDPPLDAGWARDVAGSKWHATGFKYVALSGSTEHS